MTLQENIIKIRKEKGMSVQEVADMMEVSRITIYKIETGRQKITTEWCEKYAELMKVKFLITFIG